MVSYLSELQFDFLDSPVSSSPEYPALFNHFPSFGDSHLPVSMGIHDTDSSYSLDTGRSPLSPVSSVSSTSDVPKPVSGPSHSSSPPLKETGCSDIDVKSKNARRKKSRTTFTESQINRLEERYRCHRYLPTDERVELAEELRMTNQQVTKWFQNRRMKEKRQECNSRDAFARQRPGGSPSNELPILQTLPAVDGAHFNPAIDVQSSPAPCFLTAEDTVFPGMHSPPVSTFSSPAVQSSFPYMEALAAQTPYSSPFPVAGLQDQNLPSFLQPYTSQCSHQNDLPYVDFPSIQPPYLQTPQFDQFQEPPYFS